MNTEILFFKSSSRGEWIYTISNYVERIHFPSSKDHYIRLVFSQSIEVSHIEPTHIVTLACLIQFLAEKGYHVLIDPRNRPVYDYLWYDVRLKEYWKGGKNYTPSQDDTICNLWRIVDSEKEMHSIRVHDYLQQHFFQHKDLTAVKNSLDEAYCNISDHAEAGGNAFSFIKYDSEREKLQVAVCDFGKGIARSIRSCEQYKDIDSDDKALSIAIIDGETARSQSHNRGFGLGNIITSRCSSDDIFRLISNRGFVYITGDLQKTFPNNFNFPGTLMYYELSLSQFDDLDILSNFEF